MKNSIVLILCIMLWALSTIGCATEALKVKKKECRVEVILEPGAEWDPDRDPEEMRLAQLGCEYHYGPGACLSKLFKIADLRYKALCRRAPK